MDLFTQQQKQVIEENKHLNEKILNVERRERILEDRVNKLEMILDEPLRNERKNDIVLAGLPPNLTNTQINAIFAKLGTQSTNIKSIAPIIKKQEGKQESCLYVIKLISEESKMDVMSKKKKFGELFTAEFNLTGKNNEIFFRHHFSPLQSKLYFEAKKIKINNKMAYLWFSQNKIFLRENSSSRIFSITNFNDITKINQIYNN